MALWTEETPAFFDQSGFLNRHFRHITRTDAEGKFAFLPTSEVLGIIAVDERGYAESVKEPSLTPQRLTLRPWGRVAGSLMVGRQAGRGQQAGLSRVGLRMFPQTVTADGSGAFVFARVPPGEYMLSRVVDGSFFSGQSIRVQSGETIHATLGGTGRKVIGRFTWPGGEGSIDWKSQTCETRFFSKALPPPGSLPVSLQTDGSFSVEDVPAGIYRLTLTLSEAPATPFVPFVSSGSTPPPSGSTNAQAPSKAMAVGLLPGRPIGSAGKTIEVPATPEHDPNAPLDIGTLEVKPLPASLTSRK